MMNRFFIPASLSYVIACLMFSPDCAWAASRFEREFAPGESLVAPVEQPFRESVSLNGRWQFQPLAVPRDYRRSQGVPPELPLPAAGGWEAIPLKIPSPWNVNTWGCGRNVGAGTPRPYTPSSLYYPSYPEAWDGVEMGWLRRTFRVPGDWADKQIVLHFEAVAGQCQVLVNSRSAGEHFDSYLPFDLDVTRLVRRGEDNELLVGIRNHRLFNKSGRKYAKMIAPYPCGSNTEGLIGIWQDVYLLGRPRIRIEDVFVKPLLDQNVLELEITLRNDTQEAKNIELGGTIHPWVNLAGAKVLDAPEPKWRLDPAVLSLSEQTVQLPAGGRSTLTIRQSVPAGMQTWSPEAPHLYGAVLRLSDGGSQIDCHYTRFGWRQLKIAGPDLLLNGKKIQLFGDLVHPFGPCTMSRRFVWAWYRMVQDFGGNAVRPHAQIHPRIYLDLADEMGILVLDETAIFGSSIQLNFEEPEAWTRFAEHYDGLVLRDRNHPSVFGWSFGNELFAIFSLNAVSPQDTDRWYARLAELGLRARRLDPTRDWISCDGDDDLRGTLPVWSKHFGHGLPLDRLPAKANKPLMVGESGGSYYARPAQLAEFNGQRAFENYEGRNEALAIDLYDNLVHMARPRLTYFSASETVWFGLEHLGLGYDDFSRLPDHDDGVLFSTPFTEGKPGMQPERIPPYVTTLNPGWDPKLPLYKPLAMFQAQKAVLAKDGPQRCPWDQRAQPVRHGRPVVVPSIKQVAFLGDRAGPLAQRLAVLGVPLAKTADETAQGTLSIVDAGSLVGQRQNELQQTFAQALAKGGTVLVLFAKDETGLQALNRLLPATVRLNDRHATALTLSASHAWTSSFSLADLYFAENQGDRFLLKHGLEGPLADRGQMLLEASNTDWTLFNESGENAKCGAIVLYEHLHKPGPAAMVECEHGAGRIVLCSVDWQIVSRAAETFWRKLFAAMGVMLLEPRPGNIAALDENHALVNALCLGRFGADSVENALQNDFIGENSVRPKPRTESAGLTWTVVNNPNGDRFVLHQLHQNGPQKAFAVYFSYWIHSPRGLDDLLGGGPDVPRFTTLIYAAKKCRFFLNGEAVVPARVEAADYRTLHVFDGLPLKKGWNHFLVKVASDQLEGDKPGTVAVRIGSNNKEYLEQIESAVER